MHDAVRALREPESAPGDPNSSFPVPLSDRRADKGYGDLHGPDARRPDRPDRAAPRRRPPGAGDALRPHRDRLRRMVELRIDPRLRARLDASDVAPGGVPRRRPRPGRLPGRPEAAAVALAAAARRPAADDAAPPAPGHQDARRRAGDLALPRCSAGGQLGGAGLDASGPAHLADPGGPARRADAAGPGGAEQPRPDRPGGAGAAALRAARPRRDGPGARDHARRPGRSGTSAP